MMNILQKFLIKKKDILVERLSKCIKFSGTIIRRRKLHGRLRIILINIILVS